MAVTPDDLKKPKGPVVMEMFPGQHSNVVDALLQGYIDRSELDPRIVAEPDASKEDALVRALSLHYVFSDVYTEMVAKPLNLNVTEKGSHSYSNEQLTAMRSLADKWLAEFLGLLTPSAGTVRRGGTVAVPNVYTF